MWYRYRTESDLDIGLDVGILLTLKNSVKRVKGIMGRSGKVCIAGWRFVQIWSNLFRTLWEWMSYKEDMT